MNTKNTFAIRLKELREINEISQYKLADALNLSRSVLSNYEQGIREPDFNTLRLIANYFNVSIDFLLGESEIKERLLSREEMKKYANLLKQIENIKGFDVNKIGTFDREDVHF